MGLRSSSFSPINMLRHKGEMERHVKFVALAKVGAQIGGPLVSLGQKHLAGIKLVQLRP